MSENEKILKLIDSVNDRLDDLADSYHILNESHVNLEKQFIALQTEIKVTMRLVRWLISPTFILAALSFLMKAAEHLGWM